MDHRRLESGGAGQLDDLAEESGRLFFDVLRAVQYSFTEDRQDRSDTLKLIEKKNHQTFILDYLKKMLSFTEHRELTIQTVQFAVNKQTRTAYKWLGLSRNSTFTVQLTLSNSNSKVLFELQRDSIGSRK